jgi:hypothetical protein
VNDYPVRVRIDYPQRSSRGWAILTIFLIKLLALIPHGIVLAVLGVGAAIVFVIAQIAVVATGVFPPGLFAFLTGYIRWYTRVEAFLLSVTDRYPPFSLESDPSYPVDVEVDYPQSSSKTLAALSLVFVVIGLIVFAVFIGDLIHNVTPSTSSWRRPFSWVGGTGAENPAALFRLILLIPHLIIVAILGIAVGIIWFIVQWVILFVARFPEGMHKFVAQWLGWAARVAVYSNGLTDSYPPFTLETVDWGPAAAGPAAGGPAGGQVAGAPVPPPPPLPSSPPPVPPTTGPEGTWVDDRFPQQPPGEERTRQLPPSSPPPVSPGPQPPASTLAEPPAPPAGEGQSAPMPPQAPEQGPTEQTAPESPAQPGEPAPQAPPSGPVPPPTPPQAPPPPQPPH